MKKVPFKRRRLGLTDYKKRLKLLRSGKHRFVVRLSNKYVNCQFIKYESDGDVTVAAFNSRQLSEPGKNLQAAYLTGYKTGLMALKKGVKEAVLDTGLKPSVKHSRIYAALKGAVDAGVSIPHSSKVLPSDELLKKDKLIKRIKRIESEVK